MKKHLHIFSVFLLLTSNNSWATDKFFPLPPRGAPSAVRALDLKATAPKFFPLNNAGISARAPMPLTSNRVAPPIKTAEELPPTPAQNNSKPKMQLSEIQAKQILSLYAQND
jgi:hypothetical protein